MHKAKKSIFFIVLLIVSKIFMQPVAAQDEFVNEEIKVGHHQPVDIRFDKEIVSITFSPTGIYNIDDQTAKRITISCEKPNPGIPCTLTLKVGEGKKIKTHTFRILYREEITDDEMLFDYSDPKKLKAAIKANHERPQTASEDKPPVELSKPVTETPKTTAPSQKPPVIVAPGNNTAASTDYASILNQAYSAYDNGDYTGALTLVQKALNLRPDDRQAKSLKKDIDDKLNEKQRQEEKIRKEKYYNAQGSGDVALSNYDYDKAEFYYLQARPYEDPGSNYIKNRLAEIDLKKKTKERDDLLAKAQKEKDDNYRKARSLADMAFDKRDYEYAKQQYREALKYKEQDSYANAQLIEIDNRIVREKKEIGARELQAKYNDARKTADDYFNTENYELARAAYNEALQYSAGDPYSTSRLKEIDKAIARKKQTDALKQRQSNYTEAITIADAAFNAGDYDVALEKYNSAAKWIPGEPYPAKKISEIRTLQRASAAKAEEDRRQAEKQKKLDDNYTLVINKANGLFGKQNFSDARLQYKQALTMKPYEQYPQEKITEIDNILAGRAAAEKARKDSLDAAAARKVKYNDAVARGKKASAVKDYPGARQAYSEALLLNDTATFPQNQINNIDAILRDIAAKEKARQDSIERVRVFNATFDSLMVVGSNAKAAENYDEAISIFRQAIDMKPAETNPRYLLKSTIDRKNDKLLQDSLAKEEEYFSEYTQTKNDGLAAMKERRFADAKILLAKALTMMRPNRFYGNDKEYLINRINAIDATIARGDPGLPASSATTENNVSKPVAPVTTNTPAAAKTETKIQPSKSNSGSVAVSSLKLTKQVVPLPYTRQELFSKYPRINFFEPPPGQGFNVSEYYDTTENYRVSQSVMTENHNLNITDNLSDIYLTCESIIFSGTNAFYKLKVSNNSKEDFLVGQMVLTWQKKRDGFDSKLYPCYVSSFPLLLPGREISIIYVAKSVPLLSDNEKLIFSLKDRQKKIKLSLNIPIDLYNGESARQP